MQGINFIQVNLDIKILWQSKIYILEFEGFVLFDTN